MILCDNIVFELQPVGGVSKYWSKTIVRLDSSLNDIAFLEGPKVMNNVFRRDLDLRSPILQETGPPVIRRFIGPSQRPSVFHSSYYRISRRAGANVITIHDLMNEMLPSSYRDLFLSRLKKRACSHAKAITVVSQRTKIDLLRHYPFIDSSRVHVIYNGVGNEYYPEILSVPFTAGSEKVFPREYFLYVGTRGYCKNFPYVLEVFAEARRQGFEVPLIVVGGGSLSEVEWDLSDANGIPREAIRQISNLPNTTLRQLYSNCLALLIPSIYEGFGLPAAEGARCGALVLSARGSALDEIVGETDFAFDLSRDDEPKRVIGMGLKSAEAEAARRKMQFRSKMFSWDISTTKLMEVYDQL